MTYLPPILLVILLVRAVGWRKAIRETSAVSAANWAIVAIVTLLLCCLLMLSDSVGLRTRSGLQYAAAVMLLTPLVDILGARRPGHNAWPWFVVLPMIAVLQWPVVSQLVAGNAGIAVEVPTPTFCGFLFVVIMGCGNYFGTSYTGASLLLAGACVLTALPVTEWVDYGSPAFLLTACICLLLAAFCVPSQISNPPPRVADERLHQHLWADFRNIYGMVWAKRVMDRVNQFAVREKWTVQMTLDGFQSLTEHQRDIGIRQNSPDSEQLSIDDRPLVILCWVLRRFVDDGFLLKYLPQSIVAPNASSRPAD